MADPWKRYRLLACIVVMLGIMAAGIYGRFNPPPPPPYVRTSSVILDTYWEQIRGTSNPFTRLEWEYDAAADALHWHKLKRAAAQSKAAAH